MGKDIQRRVDILVLSDIHLGTYGCQAAELLRYLKSIDPGKVILNGDIIDMWLFSARYWPKTHMQVVKHITGLMTYNKKVIYLTGNHDEMLRKFTGFRLGSFRIENKLLLKINNKKAWIFHGDVFDVTMQNAKWLAKLGALGYDALIYINTFVNFIMQKLGREKISLSKRIKDNVKKAVQFIDNFEKTAADIAIDNGYHYVVCGHIHKPAMKTITTEKGQVTYLNSGDWVENLTALECTDGIWSIYSYRDDPEAQSVVLPRRFKGSDNRELFDEMLEQLLKPAR